MDISHGLLDRARARARPVRVQWLTAPAAMQAMFADAGFTISDPHRVRRPAWTLILSDLPTVGVKPPPR